MADPLGCKWSTVGGPDAPASRLHGTEKWSGKMIHLHAVEVHDVDGEQRATNEQHQTFLDAALELFPGEHWDTHEIKGRSYVVLASPGSSVRGLSRPLAAAAGAGRTSTATVSAAPSSTASAAPTATASAAVERQDERTSTATASAAPSSAATGSAADERTSTATGSTPPPQLTFDDFPPPNPTRKANHDG